MTRQIEMLKLLPADRIIIPKSEFRLVQHHAIYLGKDYSGQDLIIENKMGVGVRIITGVEFFKDSIGITRIERFKGNNHQRKLAVQAALKKISLPYNLINYNCEHFANEIQYGKIKSEQVRKTVAGLMVILLFGFLLTE
jgi:uncharacterized protein YycO